MFYFILILSIEIARQSSSFISITHPLNIHSPSANLYLSGKDVTNLFTDASTSIPITDFLTIETSKVVLLSLYETVNVIISTVVLLTPVKYALFRAVVLLVLIRVIQPLLVW